MVELTINGKEYDVVVATTEEEREKGLQNVSEMDSDEGMLFIFPEEGTQEF